MNPDNGVWRKECNILFFNLLLLLLLLLFYYFFFWGGGVVFRSTKLKIHTGGDFETF